MKLGADRKRIAALSGLVLLAAVVVYENFFTGGSSAPAAARPNASAEQAILAQRAAEPPRAITTRRSSRPETREFTPLYGTPTGGVPKDPSTIDPAIRLDLLAKVQQVQISGGGRNLFQFGASAPAAPITPLPKVAPIAINRRPFGPEPPPKPLPPVVVEAPKAPPITMKYYGFASPRAGHKRAFLLDGDEIIVAAEGETVKRHYKLVRIGVNSLVMEDTDFKTEQTVPLAEELPS